jgi:hypothetical protein
MTPERATTIFRAILETPNHELDQVPRRMGLQAQITRDDLDHMRELLRAMIVAIQSSSGPNWDPVTTAWAAIVTRHGKIQESAMGPAAPQWVRNLPPKPGLGDPAPFSPGQQQPVAQAYVPPPIDPWSNRPAPPAQVASQAYGQPYAQPPLAPSPHAGQRRVAKTDPGTPQLQQASAPAHMHVAGPAYGAAATAQHYGHQPAQQAYAPPPQQPGGGYQPARNVAAQAARPEPLGGSGAMDESVSRYAAFCAACAMAPDKVFVTMVEYGISSPEARQKLDELWQERFDENAGLFTQWEQLVTQYREQLKARG